LDQSLAEAVKSYTDRVDESRELFVATLSHDLRNPLNAISLSTQILVKSGQLDEEHISIASRTLRSVNVMNGLIHDLLDFTRTSLGAGMPLSAAPADLQDLCREVLDEFRVTHSHRDVRLAGSGDTSGEWDAARLRQVLSNLLANAVEHGAHDTPVEVTAKGEECDVLLAVKNHGVPIPPLILARIFDPFVRGSEEAARHPQASGVGLGLYIARQIVIAHGGTITVTSGEPAGTVFTVRLPRR
jgi:signal transduction histidine kinase